MQITTFDRANAKVTQDAALAALIEAAGKLGLKVTATGGAIDFAELILKFKFEPLTKALESVARDGMTAEMLGLPEDIVGREFISNGKRYRVTGLNIARQRFPVTANRLPDGKAFKFSVAVITHGLAQLAA